MSTLPACSGVKGMGSQPVRKLQSEDAFPLRSGAYWIYEGRVEWEDRQAPDGIAQKTLSWKMEVIRTATIGRYDIAVMKGHPSDLAFYQEGRARSEYLIVRDGNKYYRIDGSTVPDIATLESKLNVDSLFLVIPPPKGCLARNPDENRNDLMYCWAAEDIQPIRLDAVKGVPAGKNYPAYELVMRTNPDHQFVTFASGVGITAYVYGHHGSVSEVDLRLVEYHQPG